MTQCFQIPNHTAGSPVRILTCRLRTSTNSKNGRPLWRSVVTDPHLCARWGAWLTEQLAQFGSNESGPALEAVRFAADGIWMGLLASIAPADHDALHAYLRGLTYPTHGVRD
jgi:hypothetical protein